MEVVRVEATNMDDPTDVKETEISVNYKEILRAQTPVITGEEEVLIDANSQEDEPITRVHAELPTSRKMPISFNILDNPGNLFRIDGATGELFLNADPSHIRPGEYDVVVQAAVPGGQSSSKAITVRVVAMLSPPTNSPATSTSQPHASTDSGTPASADSPTFTQREYTFVVEHPQRGAQVGQLSLSNRQPSTVRLSIEPPQFRDWFSIDSSVSRLLRSTSSMSNLLRLCCSLKKCRPTWRADKEQSLGWSRKTSTTHGSEPSAL